MELPHCVYVMAIEVSFLKRIKRHCAICSLCSYRKLNLLSKVMDKSAQKRKRKMDLAPFFGIQTYTEHSGISNQ